MVLATISEQRKVSFASRRVVRGGNEGSSHSYSHSLDDEEYTYTHTYAYANVDVVEARFIPPLSRYSSGDKHSIWYTTEEIKAMRQNAFRDIDLRKEEMKYIGKKRCTSGIGNYTSDIRGLERLVYDGDNHDCLKKRYECLRAVLQEQYNQRRRSRSCLDATTNTNANTNSNADDVLDFESDCNLDDERIRQVCMLKGDTRKSQQKAHQLARDDEADVKEYLQQQQQQQQNHRQETGSNCNHNHYSRQQQHAHAAIMSPVMGRNRAKIEMAMPTSSSRTTNRGNDCCWCVKVVDVVGRSLLFHSLLKPFLTMNNQVDAFTFLEPAHRPQ